MPFMFCSKRNKYKYTRGRTPITSAAKRQCIFAFTPRSLPGGIVYWSWDQHFKSTYRSDMEVWVIFVMILNMIDQHTRFRSVYLLENVWKHYNDVIMGAIASQITSLTIVYSTVYSDADHRNHQSSRSLAFVRGSHRGGEFPAQMASNAENDSIWWRHHAYDIKDHGDVLPHVILYPYRKSDWWQGDVYGLYVIVIDRIYFIICSQDMLNDICFAQLGVEVN